NQLGLSQGEAARLDQLGLKDTRTRLQDALTATPFLIQIEINEQEIQKQLVAAFAGVRDKLGFIPGLENALGKAFEDTPQGITQGIADARKEVERLQQSMLGAKLDEEAVANTREE